MEINNRIKHKNLSNSKKKNETIIDQAERNMNVFFSTFLMAAGENSFN